ncbi:Leucine Rich Repeat [Seminavis robusta]|uniref:Leucine Rich Repeat n=1 Tax=Seminavis robusta TaxID=568900 RepID=A0A9N8HPZ0_9STRA|nr:Leucine Rich Repeat [Seminavis robusta]|eukprot:Sro1119_g243150.1 Leucine Rich Repeat (806) ;mRNA; f:6548-9051
METTDKLEQESGQKEDSADATAQRIVTQIMDEADAALKEQGRSKAQSDINSNSNHEEVESEKSHKTPRPGAQHVSSTESTFRQKGLLATVVSQPPASTSTATASLHTDRRDKLVSKKIAEEGNFQRMQSKSHHDADTPDTTTTSTATDQAGVSAAQANGKQPRQDQQQPTGTGGTTSSPPNQRQQQEPGAYASGWFDTESLELEPPQQQRAGLFEDHSTALDPHHLQDSYINSHNNSHNSTSHHGLAVANLVDEPSLPFGHAEDAQIVEPFDGRNRRNAASKKRFKTHSLLGVILLIAIGIVLMAVLVPGRKDNNDDSAPSGATSAADTTQAPTSTLDYILSLFPPETVEAIQTDPESSQSKAFQWLLGDDDDALYNNYTDQRILQKFALATLYYATNGDMWANHQGWLNYSVHECDWFNNPDFAFQRVIHSAFVPGYLEEFVYLEEEPSCDDDGLFKHLWLDGNTLEGTLPEELYMLTTLETFSVGFNEIDGTISSRVGQLTNLEGLDISDLLQAKVIPSEIGLLTNLRSLSLYDNGHSGILPTEIWQLTNIMYFFLGNYVLEGATIPPEVGNMSKVKWFIFEDCSLPGTIPTEFGNLDTLEWLGLGVNSMTGTIPSELGRLPMLKRLDVEGSSLHGTLPTELGLLSSFTALKLGGNAFSGTIPTEYGLLTNLAVNLDLSNSRSLTGPIPTELGLLTSLLELSLLNNNITGEIPSELGFLTSVGYLNLANNSLTGTMPNELSSLQATLHTLAVEGNPLLSGTLPAEICSINGSCIGTSQDPCTGPSGLSFDCTSILCGCGCQCG